MSWSMCIELEQVPTFTKVGFSNPCVIRKKRGGKTTFQDRFPVLYQERGVVQLPGLRSMTAFVGLFSFVRSLVWRMIVGQGLSFPLRLGRPRYVDSFRVGTVPRDGKGRI